MSSLVTISLFLQRNGSFSNMSHNYLHRGAPEDFKPHPASSRSSDHLHAGLRDIYKTAREMSANSLPTFAASKTLLESYPSQGSSTTEKALSLLASCGLDPEDLSQLAGMPDNLITMETLPRLLMEIKDKKAGKDRPSGCATSASHPADLPPSGTWRDGTHFHSEAHLPCQPSEKTPDSWNEDWQDHWGNPQPISSVSQERSLSTSSYVVDYNYGRVGEQGSRSYQSPGRSERAKYSRERSAEYQGRDPRGRVGNSRERSAEYEWADSRGRVGSSRERSDEYRWDDSRERTGSSRERSDEFRWEGSRGRGGSSRERTDDYPSVDSRARDYSAEYRRVDSRGRVGSSSDPVDDYQWDDDRPRTGNGRERSDEYRWNDGRARTGNSRERSDEHWWGDSRDRVGSSREPWREYQGINKGLRSESGRDASGDRWSSTTAGSRQDFSSDYRRVDRGRDAPPVTSKKASAHVKHPSKQESDDFHGAMPQSFPYACSLCDIVVLSQRDWTLHINGSQHAESQLAILQMYPDWDCRSDSPTGGRWPPEQKRQEEKPASTHYPGSGPSSGERHHSMKEERSRIISVKFAADTVNKAYLMDLVKPFGMPLNVAVFSTKAFLEMGSCHQAEDIVKFYRESPAVATGSPVLFSLSSSFAFPLQTSRVVCFCRLPPGKEKNTELIAIAKRFGQVKRSLFLPNRVFVEMAELEHAQKLVDYYTSHPLKMKGKNVLVSYSTEYTTLKRPSPDGEGRTSSYSSQPYRRRSSSPRRSSSNSKSESREMESTTTQTKEAGSVGELPQAGGNTQPEPKEESAGDSSKETTAELEGGNKEDSKVPAKEHDPSPMGTSKETAIVGQDVTDQAGHEDGKQEGNLKPLDSDSDIEGMEVIGEDEEDRVPDEDLAKQDVCDRPEKLGPKQEPAEVSEAGLPDVSAGRSSSENDGMAEQVTPEDLGQAEPRGVHSEELKEAPASEEEEPDFPESLEQCITLDEVLDEDDDRDGHGNAVKYEDKGDDKRQKLKDDPEERGSGRVLYVGNLPKAYYTDAEFVRIVKGLGTVRRYFLIRSRQEGFIEMDRAEEARRAEKELTLRPPQIHWSFLMVHLSRKYQRLTCGWSPEPDPSEERTRRKERRGSSRSEEKEGSGSRSRSKSTQEEPPTKMARVQQEKEPSKERQREREGSAEGSRAPKEAPLKANESETKSGQEPGGSCIQSGTEGECGTDGSMTHSGAKAGEQVLMEVDAPHSPVGREFVQPVVGYLCSLCDAIFASEDEAKNKHCSSLSHRQRVRARLEAHRKPGDSDGSEQKKA
ncbi:RNA-binding protein 20-like isoform X2 [Scleropages formosus]|uniref:RNA-binding protein 20-like isoform X2 n=1 Tax=Scleropages formosus TaxID=113540 RepID=UPI0010FA8A2E|nr:RNA-binding protein 20-like isoform X2 [Scleropages formosus]